jgi:hypothetical protein
VFRKPPKRQHAWGPVFVAGLVLTVAVLSVGGSVFIGAGDSTFLFPDRFVSSVLVVTFVVLVVFAGVAIRGCHPLPYVARHDLPDVVRPRTGAGTSDESAARPT